MAHLHALAFQDVRPWSEDEFSKLLAHDGTFAVAHGHAFALIRVILDEAELLTLATHPDHRQKGYARQIMGQWQDTAQKAGAKHAFLEVASDNIAARALYTTCGYQQTGLRPSYYARSDGLAADAVLMARSLT